MARLSFRLIPALVFAASLTLPSVAQNPTPPQSQPQPVSDQAIPSDFTVRTYTRMVNLELVVKDSKGNHVEGLKADDFQIEEQTPAKSGKWHPQKIAEFREVHVADLAPPAAASRNAPGVYSNAIAVQKDAVPLTILLVDGLNTPVEHQAQVHVQMLKMLRQLPPNVPVAVFLLGDRLEMLQSFTMDPKLLQVALSKAISTANVGMAKMDPRDDPDSVENLEGGRGQVGPEIPAPASKGGSISSSQQVAGMAASVGGFSQRIFAFEMDERIDRTIKALATLGQDASGYPGRKNLLWLSTSFPINLASTLAVGAMTDDFAEYRGHWGELQQLSAALSDAKVAVYPVSLAGVQTLQAYEAGARPPDVTPRGMADNTSRDIMMQTAAVDTMHEIADGTGGKVCAGDNDLGDCVHKAMDDSSDYYEISYYSDSTDWNGEFRKVAVKSAQHGARLAYRRGYFASPRGSPTPEVQSAQLQSDCHGYLSATAIPFTARSLPSNKRGQLRFSLLIDSSALSIPATADGGHQLSLAIGVCTYNEKGWLLKLMNYPVNLTLDAKRYETLIATGKLTDTISIPAPKPAAVRLLVKDVATGKLGSIYIKTGDLVAAAPQ
jgi:VWFA-related protein